MRLSARRLNRTLLARQHLLARTDAAPAELCRDLIGLQAQENLSPYLSLAARLLAFDPYEVTRALEERTLVRLLTLRGTIHLLTADDALLLRPWTSPVHEREIKVSQAIGEARNVNRQAFAAEVSRLLADGPLPQKELGMRLAERFPAYSPTRLAQLARSVAPLAQLPPRGTWKGSGGVVYANVDRWVGRPLVVPTEADAETIVRRYLRAFGPATAADVTTWSGVTKLAPVLNRMEDLVRHEDEAGRTLFDLPDGILVDEDAPAPVRLLGTYDNVWLAHAQRDRVTTPEQRKRWMGTNGGMACVVLVDGRMEGLWRVVDGRAALLETFRDLTAAERAQLDDEVARVDALLTR